MFIDIKKTKHVVLHVLDTFMYNVTLGNTLVKRMLLLRNVHPDGTISTNTRLILLSSLGEAASQYYKRAENILQGKSP